MPVAVAYAVEVVILQDAPSTVFVWPLTDENVLGELVLEMGRRPGASSG